MNVSSNCSTDEWHVFTVAKKTPYIIAKGNTCIFHLLKIRSEEAHQFVSMKLLWLHNQLRRDVSLSLFFRDDRRVLLCSIDYSNKFVIINYRKRWIDFSRVTFNQCDMNFFPQMLE